MHHSQVPTTVQHGSLGRTVNQHSLLLTNASAHCSQKYILTSTNKLLVKLEKATILDQTGRRTLSSPPDLQIYFLLLLHFAEITTVVYRDVCLPSLVKIPRIVIEKSHQKGFLWPILCRMTLTFDKKLIISCPCPVNNLCKFAWKLVHPLSKYRDHKTAVWMDDLTTWEHASSGHCGVIET